MRDGKRLFTAVYIPKDQSRKYPILLTRTPYSVKPYGADQYREVLGPSALFDKAGYIFALPGRARPLDVGGDIRQCAALHSCQEGPKGHRRDQRHLRHHRLADQARARTTTAKSGMTGNLLSRLLHRGGNDRCPPGPQGRLAPGARDRLVHRRRLAPQRRLVSAAQFQLPGRLRPAAAAADQKVQRRRSTTRRPTGTASFSSSARSAAPTDRLFKGETAFFKEVMQHGTYDDFWKARNIRPHLKNIKPAVMTVGGWFDAENLFGALEVYKTLEKNSPKTSNRLVMGPWVHGGWRGRAATAARSWGTFLSTRKRPSSIASRSNFRSSSTISRAKAGPSSRRPGSSRRERTSGGSTRLAAQERQAQVALFQRGRQARRCAPGGRRWQETLRRRRLRRVRERPGPARSLHGRRDRHRHGQGIHDGRPAFCLAPPRRAGLHRPPCWRRI